MGAVVGSVAIVESGAPAPASTVAATPPPAPAAVPAGPPASMSFADDAPAADRAAALLDEVLAEGETPTHVEGEPAPAAAAPAEPAPEVPAPPTNDVEAARLRKGFAKLAEEKQRLVDLQNAARNAAAAAQSYASKAQKHDELVATIEKDPAAFLLAHGGEALVQKALQGFIEMEKSPAEREVAKLRQERDQEKLEAKQRGMEESAARWRNETIAKVSADERFDLINTLGLQSKVIEVITSYYDKHSQRDGQGNVTVPVILQWDIAAQAVEDAHAAKLEGSKRYGKRAPAAPPATPAAKDTPSAKPAQAPAKKAPTSLSSVPVADAPSEEEEFSSDPDERQRQVLAALGVT